ncbi:ribosomal protein S18 acetylase RimI-like enzyme [Ulvibacter sp. MAR_2010_11]|uniref:GNAT family N-acetyltransferase n=1 Tax=Ulvibacter sp. MAR_2010_11 TaxID=1250229 RepID=UPI000C2C9355|nr:GNAT family N-acetyltransferase [Ulvibacter sp. MAR_2010_11]PKA84520.1 ribosomal protein S18 acetylase RimI-like enzyme [Ulvibacter sp. MAR_2010_11]
MKLKNLNDIEFDVIVECFLAAFENYYVSFPKDKAYFKQRWEMSNIDYSLSYGMFDGNRLIGFILHGIEKREGHLTAFNLATGVIPEYRGKKITKQIYEFAVPHLKANGMTKCQLEVIKENSFAIKAYQDIGFTITKQYKCFAGEIKVDEKSDCNLKEMSLKDLNFDVISNQSLYSWENQLASVRRGNFKYYQVYYKNEPESFFIINDQNGYIPQFEVLVHNEESWRRLFSGIQKISEKIKINNIDEKLVDRIQYLKKFGLENTIDQFEMEMFL